jgi:WD40 repeat protein
MGQVFRVRFEKLLSQAVVLHGSGAFAERKAVAMKTAHCLFAVAVWALARSWLGESLLAQPTPHRFTLVGDLKVHDQSMAAAAFSSNGDLIATTSIDRTVRVTDWRTGKTLVTLEGFSPGEEGTWDRTVLFLKDGERLLTANSAASLELWEWRTKKRLWKQEVGARSLALSPDETVLITADWEDPAVRAWDLATGKPLHQLKGVDGPVTIGSWSQGSVAYAPSGKLFASAVGGTRDASAPQLTLTVWNAETRKPVAQLKPSQRTHALAWSPNGEQLAGGGVEGVVFTLRLSTAAALVADGAKVKLLLQQLDDDKFDVREKAHEELKSLGAAIQRDLEQAVEGKISAELRFRLEELLKKARGIAADVEFLPKEHQGTVMDVAYSPDSRLLASVSRDYQEVKGRLVVWDSSNTEKPIFSWDGPGLTSVSFSRDGKRLLTSSQDSRVRIWEVEPSVGVEIKAKP